MKKIAKYISIGLAAVSVASCADLDTQYLGGMISSEDKTSVLEADPSKGVAAVTGIYSQMYVVLGNWSGHLDFGYPAMMIAFDQMGMDYVCKNSGYNWFSSYAGYTGGSSGNTYASAQLWFYMYQQIRNCNSLLKTTTMEPSSEQAKFMAAQALATRAFDYWNLIQFYQFNYVGSENLPGVPILTEENQDLVAQEGAGRGTVQDVYDQIMSDINAAITFLEGNPTQPSDLISVKPKRMITLASAYGLRARFYLTMHKYAEAAADARSAINSFNGSPYTMDEISKPGFTDIADHSWMWGIAVAEDQDGIRGGSIVNFPAMSCSFVHGYADQGGAWKWCGKKLYDYIPGTDVRKNWFLDEDRQNGALNDAQRAWINKFILGEPNYGADASANMMPYTNVKFDAYQGVVGTGLNASDIPLMRVEEMYLIEAEGMAMSGNTTGGVQALNSFVQTYRDPAYNYAGGTAEEIQDEIWRQRRVELWGEGFSFFDIMRLHKDIDRRGYTWPTQWVFVIPYGSDYMRMIIPDDEITSNPKMSQADNNPNYSAPNPVADEY